MNRHSTPPGRYLSQELGRVAHPWRWLWWGVALEAIGVALPVLAALRQTRHDGLGASITRATVRLVWHQIAQRPGDVAVIALGVLVFVAGCVVMARPLVRNRWQLVVAVPAAALLGVVIFGVVALLVAVVIALADSGVDGLGDLGWMPGSGRRRDDDDDRK